MWIILTYISTNLQKSNSQVVPHISFTIMYGINHGKLHKMNIPPETRPILPKKEMSSSKSLNFVWLLVSGILNNPMFQSNPITFTSEKKKKNTLKFRELGSMTVLNNLRAQLKRLRGLAVFVAENSLFMECLQLRNEFSSLPGLKRLDSEMEPSRKLPRH